MIEAQKISKMYSRGVYAVRELSLRIDKGEFVFLTGPSGAGKSTLLRLLLRQEVPTEGRLVHMREPTEWSDTQPKANRHAPVLGEHTSEILAEAGYSAAEIAAMLAEGAVIAADALEAEGEL